MVADCDSRRTLVLLALIASILAAPTHVSAESTYTMGVERAVKRGWEPPKERFSYSAGVRFKIWSNGAVTDLIVFKSSGLPKADEAALRAVRQATPFPKLPQGSPDFLELEFDLKYAVNEDKLRGDNDPKEGQPSKSKTASQKKATKPKAPQ